MNTGSSAVDPESKTNENTESNSSLAEAISKPKKEQPGKGKTGKKFYCTHVFSFDTGPNG
jgi:hypothetical protein